MKKNSKALVIFLGIAIISLASLVHQTANQTGKIAFAASASSESPQNVFSTSGTLGGHKLDVMLARNSAEKTKGLMYFSKLSDNQGMLFVYDTPQIMSFWMKNTKIPLDLVFFSENLEITEWIEGMLPGYGKPDGLLPHYTSKRPAQYAIELSAGSVVRLGLKPGDRLEIPITLLYSE